MFSKIRQQFAEYHRMTEARKQAHEIDEHAQGLGDWQQNNWKSFSEEVNESGGEIALKVVLLCTLAAIVLSLMASELDRYLA